MSSHCKPEAQNLLVARLQEFLLVASSCSGASMCALALCFHFGASPEPYTLKAEDCQSTQGGGSRFKFEVPFDSPHDRAWKFVGTMG